MTGVSMPDEHQLPVGPQRALTAAIHELYLAAGKPGTRKISNAIRDRDDLPDTVSHEAVRAILTGTRSRWHKVESVVRQLIVWSVRRLEAHATVAKIHKLWVAVDQARAADPDGLPTDPAVLRQAIRELHRPTHDAAVASFLRTLLYVPQGGEQTFFIAATSSEGLWISAFTSINRLRAHQKVTVPHWTGDWIELTGAELIQKVHTFRVPAGILVDPAPAIGDDVTETLPLSERVGAENGVTSCDLLVFVDESTESIPSPDPCGAWPDGVDDTAVGRSLVQ
jgi:hypothetical protein